MAIFRYTYIDPLLANMDDMNILTAQGSSVNSVRYQLGQAL
jgi:hypothetical protein